MKVILCEKPSVAQDIAKALGKAQKKDGYIQAGDYAITWAFGHLFEIDDEVAPKKWSLDTLPIFPEKFKYRLTKGAGKQFKVIKELLKKADGVVIATDAGREGELIARLILYQAGWKDWDKTYRLWTSEALTSEVVKRELKNLKPAKDFDSLYWSALGRQHADWIVGINLTRLITLKSSDRSVWSVGRVQTPTLRLVVERDLEIERFKPEPYWIVKALFEKEGSTYEGIFIPQGSVGDNDSSAVSGSEEDEGTQEEDRGYRLSKEEADRVLKALEKESKGVVEKVERKRKREKPPLLHSLTSLQREANKLYGFSAKKTLDVAQRLYEVHKCLSYPRTDAQYLAESSKELVKKVLLKLGRKNLIPAVEKAGKRVFNDSKLTDHHALIPLAPLPKEAKEDERKIYDLVLRRFLGAFMPDYEYETTTITTRVGDYRFLTKGRRDIQLGWKELYREDLKESKLPELKEGDSVRKVKAFSERRETKPPPRYTEGALLKKMEKLNLGTPATRAYVIATLLDRSYVVRKGKALVSTPKGRELISKLSDSQVSSPEMTGEWENELESIYTGKKGHRGYESFLGNIKEFVRKEIENLKSVEITSQRQASPKMLKLAKSLARETGLKVDGTGFEEIKAFIDKALERKKETLEEGLGRCKCGGKILPFSKGWKCDKCGAVVWNTMYGKRIGKKTALKLLQGERVFVKGLKSKNGKEYSAYMKMDEGRVKLDFGVGHES